MTNKQRALLGLLESCESFAEFGRLVHTEVERMFADDTDPPAELGAALEAIWTMVDRFEALDEVSQ